MSKVVDNIPAKEATDIDTWLKALDKELRDIEFYSPTIPLEWWEYHAIIDRLVIECRKPESGYGDGI